MDHGRERGEGGRGGGREVRRNNKGEIELRVCGLGYREKECEGFI